MAEQWESSLPRIGGEAGAAYLSAALARIGRPSRTGEVSIVAATGGRQSIPVRMLHSQAAGSYALKSVPMRSWRTDFGGGTSPEPTLWAKGTTRTLPPPLHCPTIDIAFHAERQEYWMLMDDVGPDMLALTDHDPQRLRQLLRGLASLHSHYWGKDAELAGLPLLSIESRADIACEPIRSLANGRGEEGWIAGALDNFVLVRPLVPVFLEFLRPEERSFYLSLLEARDPILRPLSQCPATLIHGDVWHGNFALPADGGVILFDWDLASLGPAAFDLAWYWVLHFWCYPPPDGRTPADREPFLSFYADEMEGHLGSRFDREAFASAFDLCWLIAFSQLACTLTGGLTIADSPEERQRCRIAVEAALAEARRICDLRLA